MEIIWIANIYNLYNRPKNMQRLSKTHSYNSLHLIVCKTNNSLKQLNYCSKVLSQIAHADFRKYSEQLLFLIKLTYPVFTHRQLSHEHVECVTHEHNERCLVFYTHIFFYIINYCVNYFTIIYQV